MSRQLQEIAEELNSMINDGDPEITHTQADNLLLEALRISGADNVATAWENVKAQVGFWYA